MSIRTVAFAAFLSLSSVLPAAAASIGLEAIGQRLGSVTVPDTSVLVIFDRGPNGSGGFEDFFSVDDAAFNVQIVAEASDPSTASLLIGSPSYSGTVVDIAFGLDVIEALFVDATGDLVLARGAGFDPALTSFPGEGDFLTLDATLTIIDVIPIPVPAALPLALAGFGALALMGRRRSA